MQRAGRGGEIDDQALDLEQCHLTLLPPGAVTSRMPSPTELMANTRMASAVPGMAISQNEKNM